MGHASKSHLPLGYVYSRCSNVAQLANTLASQLDREGTSGLPFVAGEDGDARPLERIARADRSTFPLTCVPVRKLSLTDRFFENFNTTNLNNVLRATEDLTAPLVRAAQTQRKADHA